ncbi:phage tail tape measure protein [Luteibacter sp. E-22]|uniref:phage tail tape measure protein n=1 Tax=Luteibacter sp. E-22 TaxID=3404050 RepID=UPI003CF2361A
MDIASLGIKVTQDGVKQAEDSLEKMASAGDKAAASQDRLTEANTRANKASNTASIRAQREELSKLIGTIDPVIAKLGQLDEQERKLASFRAKGLIGDDDFKVFSDKIEASRLALSRYADASGKTAISQKQLAAANRGIPAQFTDIATSIASGQRPLSVLLQQGGQLKDMFGGIGPAARALGGYLLGLVNPFTLLAGASIALAVAWKQGSDETVAFNQALARTGSYAGTTASQLQDQARAISASVGTQHEAAAALAEVAGSGKFTAEQIGLVGKAAVDMARLTGQSTAETIKQFSDLKNEPVKAVLALNDSEHFLTTTIYEQIKALQDSGREDEAATVAMKARANAVAQRAKSVQDSAGLIERAWNGVTVAAKKAWDAMLDVGRPDTSGDQIKKIQERMEAVRTRSGPMYADLTDRQQASILATYQKSLDQLQAQERQADQDARKKSIAAQATQALADSDREADIYASREDKRAKAILAARTKANEQVEKALAAGDKASADRIRANEAKIIAGINEQYKDPKGRAAPRARQAPDFYTEDRRQIEAEIEAEGKLFDQRTRAAAAIEAYQSSLSDMLETRKAEIALQASSIGMSQVEAQRQQQINQIYADSARKRIQLVHDMNQTTNEDNRDLYARELAALDDYTKKRLAVEIEGFKAEDAARADWKAGIAGGYADIVSEASDVAGQTRNLFIHSFDSIADSLANFVTTGKLGFKSLVSSILSELAKVAIRIAASQALQSIFGGTTGTSGSAGSGWGAAIGSIVGAVANAKGGVYDSPSLSKYSNQVVSKPTAFAFAKGAALGVMGEAGSEAIMPLSRGSDGSLGVTVHGGMAAGVNVNVVVNVASDGTADVSASGDNQAFGKQFGTAVANVCKQQIAQEIRPGGQIYTAMGRR